ncbi:MAG: divergent polysaccharide deacetylase family protein [Deltaproteobacteria bacterium]|nr:divergent polysaccharide deacetylase family protein [Deltaproteobacteria bacterium]
MPAMKKKNKKKYVTAALITLIVLSVAAIIYVIAFHDEEMITAKSGTAGKKHAAVPEPGSKEKPSGQPPVKAPGKAKLLTRTPSAMPDKETRPEGRKTPVLPQTGHEPPQKEKIIIAKMVPQRLPLKQVAIIIDDLGYDLAIVRELLSIDADITYAILPLVAHSREAAEMVHKANRETLLHLPMEPLSYPREKPGHGALFTDMNDEEIVFQLHSDLASVPHVSGVNNHMGSRFMSNEERLLTVFRELKKKDLFFIDSRTTRNSKTAAASQKTRLTVASRKIFLDNERDYSKIYRILVEVADMPADGSPLIIIGHPHPETIRAIRDASKVFREKGVSIIPVSKLLQKQPS